MASLRSGKLHGISAKKKQLLFLKSNIEAAAKVDFQSASDLEIKTYNFAMTKALDAVNALLTASNAQCTLGGGAPADIDIMPDSNGALIYRCEHATPHKWKLNGDPIK